MNKNFDVTVTEEITTVRKAADCDNNLNDGDFASHVNGPDGKKNQRKKPIDRLLACFTDKHNAVDLAACVGMSLFISLLFVVFQSVNGIYPFGNAVMSSYDMLAQVAPFIEHFFDVFEGKSSLFYSFSIAGGADVFGTLAYCCISPFTPIFLLFGKGNVYYGTSVVLPLKIICVAVSAYVYLRKRFAGVSPLLKIALSLSYAFCGYLYVSNTYINWIDLLIYIPVIAWGFRKLICEDKKSTFIVGLCLTIYTCFSIACFSLLLIFPIAIAYCVLVVESEKRDKCVVNLVLSLCLAIAFSLPVLLPSLFAYLVSGRSAGLFAGLFAELKADPLYYKISYIATDGLTLFFTFACLIKYGVKRPIDRFLLAAALITLLPILCDECCVLLNFGSYNSYAMRFGFLNGFYFFYVAATYFSRCTEKNLKNDEKYSELAFGKPSGSYLIKIILTVVLSLLCAGAIVGGFFLCRAAQADKIEKWFSSRFAHSLGGLSVTAIVCGMVAIIALSGTLFAEFKLIFPRALAVILLIITCGQCAFYVNHLVYGNKKEVDDFAKIKVLTDYVGTLEGGEYARVKMRGDYLTADMPFTLHTNSYSVFSSVIDDKNFGPSRFFSFGGNGSNTIKSYNGTFFGNCLFGNEYLISTIRSAESGYVAVDGYDRDAADEYYLHKAKYAFPHAFVTSGPCGVFGKDEDLLSKYQALVKTIGGNEFSVEKVDSVSVYKQQDGAFKIKASNPKSADGTALYGEFFAVIDFGDVQVEYSFGNDQERFPVENNSVPCRRYGTKYDYFYLYFKGEAPQKSEVEANVNLYCLSDATVRRMAEKVKNNRADVTLSAGKIAASVQSAGNGDYLFLNYVALSGHTAYVNGKEVEINDDYLGFMLVPLENGMNEVEIFYSSPYVKYAVFGLIAAFLVGFLYIVFNKKKFFEIKKTMVVVRLAAYGLCTAILLFFYVFPIGVFVYKLIAFVVKAITG